MVIGGFIAGLFIIGILGLVGLVIVLTLAIAIMMGDR